MPSSLNQVGSFTAAGTTKPQRVEDGLFNLRINGTFVGTVVLEDSMDGGETFNAIESFTGDDVPISRTGEVSNNGVINDKFRMRLNCSAYTSGTVNYALTQ